MKDYQLINRLFEELAEANRAFGRAQQDAVNAEYRWSQTEVALKRCVDEVQSDFEDARAQLNAVSEQAILDKASAYADGLREGERRALEAAAAFVIRQTQQERVVTPQLFSDWSAEYEDGFNRRS